MVALKGFPIVRYTVQQLMDCAREERNGCAGFNSIFALEYLIEHQFNTQTQYPYNAQDGTCKAGTHNSSAIDHLIDDWQYAEDVDAMKEQLVQQPLIVTIWVTSSFEYYGQNGDGGVYENDPNDECSTKTGSNHEMVLVGYGVDSESGTPYWKMKNSWGTTWGENGYVRMKMGSNICNVETYTRYPIPSKSITPLEPSPETVITECIDEARQCWQRLY